jgi:ubiquinone/menaquinone biosynthesis methyltransferase
MKYSFSSINDLFSSIAPSYDLMNDVMSLGLHHVWKAVFVDRIPLTYEEEPLVYVDMACGSGDIGGRVLEKAKEKRVAIQPIFVDPNESLLTLAQSRYPDPTIRWCQESAEDLSLPHNSVDLYTISFGLRNVNNRFAALKKTYHVLKPGGQFWCLEFAHPENPMIQEAFYAYLKILPMLGNGVIGQSEPYAYLADSIRSFPSSQVLLGEVTQAGFKNATYKPLSYGVVAITGGIK